MEESDRMLILAIVQSGYPWPEDVTSLSDVSSFLLMHTTQYFLNISTGDNKFKEMKPIPSDTSSKFRFCSNLVLQTQQLGFREELSFHQFLYPEEKSTRQLLRFLVAFVSVSTQSAHGKRKSRIKQKSSVNKQQDKKTIALPATKEIIPLNQAILCLTASQQDVVSKLAETYMDLRKNQFLEPKAGLEENTDGEQPSGKQLLQLLRLEALNRQKAMAEMLERNQKLSVELVSLEAEEKALSDNLAQWEGSNCLLNEEASKLERAALVLRAEADGDSVEEKVVRLKGLAQKRRSKIDRIKTEWEKVRQPLETRKEAMIAELRALKVEEAELEDKITQLHANCRQTESRLQEREDEVKELDAKLKSQPNGANRAAFLRRVTDIVKNTRKQKCVISDVLSDIRSLQREQNEAEEKLRRVHAIVDDVIFRGAKENPAMGEAYRQLNSLHEAFGRMVGSVMETSRVGREILLLEKRLAALSKQNLNVDQVKKDLALLRESSREPSVH